MNPFINVLLYQGVWFLAVLGGDRELLLALLLLSCHLYFSSQRLADIRLMAAFVLFGGVLDTSLYHFNLLLFPQNGVIIPVWLILIWAALGTLPNHSLAWMKGRPLLSALFGAFGGPLAYYAGVRLEAASFGWSTGISLAIFALVWALIWPFLMSLSAASKQ